MRYYLSAASLFGRILTAGQTSERCLRKNLNGNFVFCLDAELLGLECYYSKYNEEQIASLVATAKKHNLLIGGGSDYHGANKTVTLGTLNSQGKAINENELTIYVGTQKAPMGVYISTHRNRGMA